MLGECCFRSGEYQWFLRIYGVLRVSIGHVRPQTGRNASLTCNSINASSSSLLWSNAFLKTDCTRLQYFLFCSSALLIHAFTITHILCPVWLFLSFSPPSFLIRTDLNLNLPFYFIFPKKSWKNSFSFIYDYYHYLGCCWCFSLFSSINYKGFNWAVLFNHFMTILTVVNV